MTNPSDGLERFRQRLHASNANAKKGLLSHLDVKRAFPWLALFFVAGAPGLWWLVQVPPRAAKLVFSCNEMRFASSTAMTLSVRRIRQLSAFGADVSIENATNLSILDAATNKRVDLLSSSMSLQDAGEAGSPSVKMEVHGSSGPFLAAVSDEIALRKLNDPDVALEVAATKLSAVIDADELSIQADRLSLQTAPSIRSMNIVASNPTSMTRLELTTSRARKPSLVMPLLTGTLSEIGAQPNRKIESSFLRCHKAELAIEAKKLSLPAMSMMELLVKWSDVKFDSFSARSEISSNPADMSLMASGLLTSASYNDQELNYNNMRGLTSLSTEKQGLIGVAVFALLWVAKQLFDRLSKRIFDRIIPEK